MHAFAIAREPRFFRSTVFRIDINHAKNHTGCGEGYNPAIYRDAHDHSSEGNLPYVNTQIAEEWNNLLTRLRGSVTWMNQENFMLYIAHFLARRNIKLSARD